MENSELLELAERIYHGTEHGLDRQTAFRELRELAKLRAEIAGAPVVPITRQVDFTGGIPISWDDVRFETTHAKLLPCDAAGNLLRLPADTTRAQGGSGGPISGESNV